MIDGIRAEQSVLGPLRELADVVMDTTDLTGATLRRAGSRPRSSAATALGGWR